MTEARPQGRLAAVLCEGDGHRSASPLDALTLAALAYLGLPMLIFLLGWLRPVAALGFLAAATLAAAFAASRFQRQWTGRPGMLAGAIIVAIALGWSALGGGSHYVYANPDWIVRDSVLADLSYSQWPPSYRFADGVHHVLRSAIGFFLPVAATAKLLGTALLPHLLFAWTALGTFIFLALLPLPADRPMRLLAALTIIVAFSGMDVLGILLIHGHYPVFPLRLEWWSDFAFRTSFSYSSLTGQLIWAPNHALPMWIGTAMFYRHWKHPDFPVLLCLLLPLLPLTTPFALPGLAPFAVLALVVHFLDTGRWPRVPLAVIAPSVLVLLLLARLQTLDVGSIVVAGTGAVEPAAAGNFLAFAKNYLAFVLMEFALLALALFPLLKHSRGVFLLAMGVLLLLPLATLGPSNDLLLRVSTPSLVLLAILTMRALTFGNVSNPARRVVIAAMLCVGAHTPFNEAARAVLWPAWQPDYTRTLVDVQQGHLPAHYIGRLSDPALRALLRSPALVPGRDQRR